MEEGQGEKSLFGVRMWANDFDTQRGGQGNVRHGSESVVHEGLADKLKHKLFGKKST